MVKPRKQGREDAGRKGDDDNAGSSSAAQEGSTVGDDVGAVVQWGGTGGVSSGIDMEQQEAILRRLFKPHKVRRHAPGHGLGRVGGCACRCK